MGQQSQRRKRGLRVCKQRSRRGRFTSRKTRKLTRKEEFVLLQDIFLKYSMAKTKQSTLGFSKKPPPPSVANGGLVCERCQKGPTCHRAHELTCPLSIYYNKNKVVEIQEKQREKENASLPPIVYHGCTRKEAVSFITGSTINKTKSSVAMEPQEDSMETTMEVPEAEPPMESMDDIEEPSSNLPIEEECSFENEDDSLANEISSETSDLEESLFLLDVYKSMSPAVLKEVLRSKMETSSTPSYKAKCSRPVVEMARHILSHFPSNFEKTTNKLRGGDENRQRLVWYNTHFPAGTTCFEVPRDDCREKPYGPYSSIVGTKFYFLRWELQDPNINLKCTSRHCCGSLVHDRFDLSKNGTMTPLFSTSGRTSWVVSMRYCCTTCNKVVHANDGELLHQLPHWMTESYPVRAKYATTSKNHHCTRDLTDILERLMITYGNAPVLSKYLYEKLGKEYVAHELAYYSQCLANNQQTASPLLNFEEWIGSLKILPSGDNLRDLFANAARSELTLSGVSDHDRHTLEMQMVICLAIFAQDHTFQVVKNFPSNLGAYAVWTVSVGSGEIACAILVASTRVADFAHAAECLARRQNWRPLVLYCDTWPNKANFWALIFPLVQGRLGLFHFLNRIVSTLRDKHQDFPVAVAELRACIYTLNVQDEDHLIRCLKDGTLNGKKHTDQEISDMMKVPKKWKRLSRFCRKEIHPPNLIVHKLESWFVKYKVDASEGKAPGQGRKDKKSGKKMFTPETKASVENQKLNCKYLQDVLPPEVMYRTVEAPKKANHDLPTYKSDRGEGALEGYHDFLGHIGNTNTREDLANSLHLEGTARHNKCVRERAKFDKMTSEERSAVPAFLRGEPAFFNDQDLIAVNNLAKQVGISDDIHEGVQSLPKDTGERFFAEYFREQQKRTREIGPHPLNDRCQCLSCANNPVPIPTYSTNGIALIEPAVENKELTQEPSPKRKRVQMPAAKVNIPMQVPPHPKQLGPILPHVPPATTTYVPAHPASLWWQVPPPQVPQHIYSAPAQQHQAVVFYPNKRRKTSQLQYCCHLCYHWVMVKCRSGRPPPCDCRVKNNK